MHLLEWPNFRTLTTPNASEGMSSGNSHSLLVGMQNGTTTLEYSLAASYKTTHTFSHTSAITFHTIYQEDLKTYVHTQTCTQMFTAA